MSDQMALLYKSETVYWLARTSGLPMFLVLILVLASACAKTIDGGSDGESHFLVSCDATCGKGYSCICGVCTESCKEDESCVALAPTAVCVEVKTTEGCRSGGHDVFGFCDVTCESAKDCSVLGSDYECSAGFCRKEIDKALPDAGDAGAREEADAIVDGADESEWELVQSNTSEELTQIWGFDDDDIWALSRNSLLHYDGRSWEVALENEQWNLTGLWGAAPDDIWAVGTYPEWIIMHYDGSGWEPYDFGETQPPGSGFSGVWGTSAQSVYAFQLSSQATWDAPWYWDGTTWKEHDAEVVYPNEEERWSTEIYSYRPQASSTSPDSIVVADFGGIVLYDGTQWSVIESGLASTCTADAAWALDSGGFLIGKSFCGIRVYGNVALIPELDLKDFSPPVVFGGLWGTSDRDIYAVGVQWQAGSIREGIMSEAHAVASHIWHYDGHSWTDQDLNGLAVSLISVWGSPSGVVWVVGDEGTILRRRPQR